MGLTAGCAVCHDHKFDPISQREFYELSAFFNNTTQPTMDGNIKDTPPTLFVPATPIVRRWQVLPASWPRSGNARSSQASRLGADFAKWLAERRFQGTRIASIPTGGLELAAIDFPGRPRSTGSRPTNVRNSPTRATSKKTMRSRSGHGSRFPGGTVRLGDRPHGRPHNYRGWDMWLEDGRIGTSSGPRMARRRPQGRRARRSFAGIWTHVFVTYDGSAEASGRQDLLERRAPGDRHRTPTGLKQHDPHRCAVQGRSTAHTVAARPDWSVHSAADLRSSPLTGEAGMLAGAARAAALLQQPTEKRPPTSRTSVFTWWRRLRSTRLHGTARRSWRSLEAEEAAIKQRGTYRPRDARTQPSRRWPTCSSAASTTSVETRSSRIRPTRLPPMPADLPRNRLGLAQWLVRPENPLTARVVVNRFWQEVFGTGLVRTTGDFGVSGELPSHPELLDWLAVEFRESGWDVKQLFRLMVESSAYRQSAGVTPDKREKDPHNRLLSRGPRFRMDGEMIRDAALARSGCLVGKLGGPSVKPYQPEGVWEAVAMPESNTHFYQPDHGDRLYRRSLYTFWKRSCAAGLAGCLQRPHPRDLHGPPRTHQYTAAGAGDAQRSSVRRGGPALGAVASSSTAADHRPAASTSSLAG